MKTFFKIFFLLVIAFPALCLADGEREDFPAVVKIETNKVQGTAFFITPDRIVTNFHIIDGIGYVEKVSIQAPSGKWYPVKSILALDAVNDLAVLEVRGYRSEHYYSLNHFMNSVQEVETAGFPGGKFQHTHGETPPIALRYGNQYFIFQKSTESGTSGSPIFKGSNLIAILKKSYSKNSTSVATPIELLKELLSKPPLNCHNRSCIKNEIKRMYQLAKKGDETVWFHWLSNLISEQVRQNPYYYRTENLRLGTNHKFRRALESYERLAEKGNAEAQMQLGSMYNLGDGVAKNPKKAFYWRKKAVKQGYPMVQLQLAFMYYEGEGVEQNLELAFYWAKKATEQGLPEAQLLLALMYYQGYGVERNLELAFYWAQKAAEWGLPTAQLLLAFMYSQGHGVEQNFGLAVYWAQKAAEQGQPTAEALLREINEKIF